MRARLSVGAILAIGVIESRAHADDPAPVAEAPTAPTIQLEVVGEKPVPASSVAAQTTHYGLDSELLQKLPGTRGDAFAAITSLPSLGRPPSLSTIYVIRGGGPEESITFVDGAPMPHAFHFGGLVAIIPSSLLQSIDVLPGSFGVAYGRATAGVIDAELSSPRSDGQHATASLDLIDLSAMASTYLGDKHTRIAIAARRSHLDVWIKPLLSGAIAGELPHYLDGEAVLEHDFSAHSRLRVAFIAADDKLAVIDPNVAPDQPNSGKWHSAVMRAHARYDATFGTSGTVFGVVALSKSSDQILGQNDEWDDARRSLFARVEAGEAIGEGRFTIGADVQSTHIDGVRQLQIPVSAFGGSEIFPLHGSIAVSRFEPGAYAQLALKPVDGISIVPGVRIDREPGAAPSGTTPSGVALVQPRLAARVSPFVGTIFKGAIGSYARPNVFDAVDAVDLRGAIAPLAVNAGPVRAVQASLGAEQTIGGGVDLSFDAWTRAERNVLVAKGSAAIPLPVAPGDPRTYVYPLNVDTARSRAMGLELLVRWKSERFLGFVGYALSRAQIRDDVYSSWRRAPFDQTHVFNLAAIVHLGDGWDVGGRFRLAVGVLDSPFPTTDIAPKQDPNLDPNRPLPQLPAIHSLDLRVEKTWIISERWTISAYAEARNVYDRRAREPLAYNYVYGYPVVGKGLPTIPNLGVRGSF